MANSIYLDHAAATPVDSRVRKAMEPFLAVAFYNPSATYAPARAVAAELEKARASVAHWLGARPAEIVFTAGGTEANNLAIHGIMQRYGRLDSKANVVVSAVEHEAVLHPAGQYARRLARVTADGLVDLEALRVSIDDKTVLLSIMYANNEIGTVQPIRAIAQLVKDVRSERREKGNTLPLYLHTDACQAPNYLDLHVARLGVDMMTINGGKMYGPKQSGVLYVKAGLELKPLILGGGQEGGLRSGTENVGACVGLATALHIAQTDRHQELERLHRLQALFMDQLKAKLPSASINGSLKKRLPNNIHSTIPGYDNERLLLQLEERGILAAAGSACSASSGEPSHVLRAIGLSDANAHASVRFTMGRATTEANMIRTINALREIIA